MEVAALGNTIWASSSIARSKSAPARDFYGLVGKKSALGIGSIVLALNGVRKMSVEKIITYMQSPEFHASVQRKIKDDRQAGAEWRRKLVSQANAKLRQEGLALDASQMEMQKLFIANELEHKATIKMICELSERAGIPLPEPTPHDMGLD